MDLQKILSEHAEWLADPSTGARADLQGANLRGAYLLNTDLRNADLQGAYLLNADLRGAIGLVYLTQTDAGYSVLAQQPEPEAPWRIRAGCRDFSIDEAIAHWSSSDYHTPSSGRRCVAAIEWFRKETER